MKTFAGFSYHVCANPKHTRWVDSIHHSAFKCLLLLGSEASFLPLLFFFFFACKGKNLLPFSQAKLFLKNNSVYPEMLPSPSSWWAESSKYCEGAKLWKNSGERALQTLQLASHITLRQSVCPACWVSAGLLRLPAWWFHFLNRCL